MTDKWMGMPLKEMTREELVRALTMLGEAYWGISALYYEQCNAVDQMMHAAIKVSSDLAKLSGDLEELYHSQDKAAEQFRNIGLKWREAAGN